MRALCEDRLRCSVHVHRAAESSACSGRTCEGLTSENQEARSIRRRSEKRTCKPSRVVYVCFRGLPQRPSEASPREQGGVRGVVAVDRRRLHFLGPGVAGVNTLSRDDLAVSCVKDVFGPVGGCRVPIQSPTSNLAAHGARVVHVSVPNALVVWQNGTVRIAVYVVDDASENEHRSEG